MKIELKNIKVVENMSEETTAFTADIHIDGVKAGYAKNDGRGGCTDYHAFFEDKREFKDKRELIENAEKHCLALPPKKYSKMFGSDAFEVAMNLENFIDELLETHLKEKDKKKFDKKMANTIMWGVPNSGRYTQVKFKVLLSTIPRLQLQGYLDKYKKDFKDEEIFLNTNLEAMGVRL